MRWPTAIPEISSSSRSSTVPVTVLSTNGGQDRTLAGEGDPGDGSDVLDIGDRVGGRCWSVPPLEQPTSEVATRTSGTTPSSLDDRRAQRSVMQQASRGSRLKGRAAPGAAARRWRPSYRADDADGSAEFCASSGHPLSRSVAELETHATQPRAVWRMTPSPERLTVTTMRTHLDTQIVLRLRDAAAGPCCPECGHSQSVHTGTVDRVCLFSQCRCGALDHASP
jgi:hypothetical protein